MFSPFKDSKMQNITSDDIEYLRTSGVTEGLFVEYKSSLVDTKKIANSIASFANSYGGWYFVGIEDGSKANTPTAVDGISLEEFRDPLSTIREAAKEHLSPTPRFFPELVTLPSGKVVIAVMIPDRQDKPIISQDGRIYRRVADSSVPTPEKDRSIIDRLVEEGKSQSKKFEDFCRDDRAHCNGESEKPWVNLYIQPYPDWLEPDYRNLQADLEGLLSFLREPLEMTFGDAQWSCNLDFNTVRTGTSCVIVGAHGGTKLGYNHLAMELFDNGWARLRIPFNTRHMYEVLKHSDDIKTDDIRGLLHDLNQKNDVLQVIFLDVANAILSIMAVIKAYLKWLGDIPSETNFNYRIEINNVWRTAPYFDSQEWANFIKGCGLTLIAPENLWQPPRQFGPSRTSSDYIYGIEVQMVTQVMLCLGLPIDVALSAFANEVVKGTKP